MKGKITCAFCGEELDEKKAVSAKKGRITKYACDWRHLYKYLVETFTTGNQINEGLK